MRLPLAFLAAPLLPAVAQAAGGVLASAAWLWNRRNGIAFASFLRKLNQSIDSLSFLVVAAAGRCRLNSDSNDTAHGSPESSQGRLAGPASAGRAEYRMNDAKSRAARRRAPHHYN